MAPEIVKLITDRKNTTSTAGICETNLTQRFISEKKNIASTISLIPVETFIFYLQAVEQIGNKKSPVK
jgi:hypothetical protein